MMLIYISPPLKKTRNTNDDIPKLQEHANQTGKSNGYTSRSGYGIC